jgi:hypothetical protein
VLAFGCLKVRVNVDQVREQFAAKAASVALLISAKLAADRKLSSKSCSRLLIVPSG